MVLGLLALHGGVMFGPGEIYSLPSSDPESRDPKDGRPHIVVSLESVDSEVVTLVTCSTESWEADLNNPPHVIIDPAGSSFATTGLSRRTVAYPGRLAICEPDDLDWFRGTLIDEMPQLRSQLLRAIGFRTGVSLSTGMEASGSLRGVVVQFMSEFKDYCGADIGVIISDPKYSRQQRFQNFVPVYPEGTFGDQAGVVPVYLLLPSGARLTKAEAVPRLAQSLLQPNDVSNLVAHVGIEDMRRIEDEIAVRMFGSVPAAESLLE